MGAVLSTKSVSQPVTLNRIRAACQSGSGMPHNVKKFEVQLLANDLNKYGFNIPVKSESGKESSVDEMCDRITQAIPNADQVCMINSKNRGNTVEALKRMVDHFNGHYGSGIQVYKNPYGEKNRENMRSIEDICDDLYMVQDRVTRSLSDQTGYIKTNLLKNIKMLKQYKEALDHEFNKFIYSANPNSGHKLDQMQSKMGEMNTLRNSLVKQLDNQLNTATSAYNSLEDVLQKRVNPMLGTAQTYLDVYAATPFSNPKVFEEKKFTPLLKGMMYGGAAQDMYCQECITKFGMRVNDYYKMNGEEIQRIVQDNFWKLVHDHQGDYRFLQELGRCRDQLLKDVQYCKLDIQGQTNQTHLDMVLNPFVCMLPESECNANAMCEWKSDEVNPMKKCKRKQLDAIAGLMGESNLEGILTGSSRFGVPFPQDMRDGATEVPPALMNVLDSNIEAMKASLGIPYFRIAGIDTLEASWPAVPIYGGKKKRKGKGKKKTSSKKKKASGKKKSKSLEGGKRRKRRGSRKSKSRK